MNINYSPLDIGQNWFWKHSGSSAPAAGCPMPEDENGLPMEDELLQVPGDMVGGVCRPVFPLLVHKQPDNQ